MQWTVRYYMYMSQKWAIPSCAGNMESGTGTSTSNDQCFTNTLSAEAIAYHTQKQAVWEELMIKADSIFKRCNPAYQSPL